MYVISEDIWGWGMRKEDLSCVIRYLTELACRRQGSLVFEWIYSKIKYLVLKLLHRCYITKVDYVSSSKQKTVSSIFWTFLYQFYAESIRISPIFRSGSIRYIQSSTENQAHQKMRQKSYLSNFKKIICLDLTSAI